MRKWSRLEKAQAESIKTVLIPQKGYKPSVLQTDFDKQAAIAEGLLVPRKMDRQPFVIEYKVPVNKVEGYMPAIKRSIDEEDLKGAWMRKTADESYYNEIDELVEEGYEYSDAVDEVAVVGEAHPEKGEVVKAFIVLKDKSATESEIIEFCKKELTAYKVPKLIEFRDELPKTNVGKILRRALRDEL